MKARKHLWIRVDGDFPLSQWWPELVKVHPWAAKITPERWDGTELSWPQLLDSARSFTLFSRQKLLIVQQADRALKQVEDKKELFQKFEACPHKILILSSQKAPKTWTYLEWAAPQEAVSDVNEKAIFRWIDQIERADLKRALSELDLTLAAGKHPLVCLQLLTRHYRMGRLITYAQRKGLSEIEISKTLKLPTFVIQKWNKKSSLTNRQWEKVFDRLSEADLHLKSGYDDRDILRKISHDLCQLKKIKPKSAVAISPQPMSLFGSSLWPVAPSFS